MRGAPASSALDPPVFPTSSKERVIKESGKLSPPDDVAFSDYPKVDYDLRIFEKNYWLYDTIHRQALHIFQTIHYRIQTVGQTDSAK
jgi:hypothetical protein